MLNSLVFTLMSLAGSASAAASSPIQCVYAATSDADRQLIAALSARGGGQRSDQESAAIERLNTGGQGCRKANNWSADKYRAAFEYARALFLQDYGKAQLAAHNLPVSPVERTYARMTPAMRSALLTGSPDPAMSTLLAQETAKAGVKPARLGREEGRVMGNILAGMAVADRARAAFDAR
jgi:hypothetical protein